MSEGLSSPTRGEVPGRRFQFRWAYLIILAAVVIFSFNFISKTLEDRHLAAEVAAVHTGLYREQQYNHRLRKQIKRDRSLSFVYQEARSWGYVKRGDRPVLVSYQHLRPHHHSVVHRSIGNHKPTWQQWWNAFFGSSSH